MSSESVIVSRDTYRMAFSEYAQVKVEYRTEHHTSVTATCTELIDSDPVQPVLECVEAAARGRICRTLNIEELPDE